MKLAPALSILLCLVTGLLIGQARAADDSLAIPHIAVTGTAVTQVPPNEMKWRLQIATKGPEVEAVAREHLQNVASLLQFLRSQDIAERELQSSRMQLRENWENRFPAILEIKKAGAFAPASLTRLTAVSTG